jgi:hypothetical protein
MTAIFDGKLCGSYMNITAQLRIFSFDEIITLCKSRVISKQQIPMVWNQNLQAA